MSTHFANREMIEFGWNASPRTDKIAPPSIASDYSRKNVRYRRRKWFNNPTFLMSKQCGDDVSDKRQQKRHKQIAQSEQAATHCTWLLSRPRVYNIMNALTIIAIHSKMDFQEISWN